MRQGLLKRLGRVRGLIVSVLAFALFLALVLWVVGGVDRRADENQLELVRGAVRRAAATCYAVEGRYPQSVEYLSTHYGLIYDQSRFLIAYDAFASNVMPEIRVVEKGVARS